MLMVKLNRLSFSVVVNYKNFQRMSGKFKVKLEGKSGKTISIGYRFPSKFAKSGTLVRTP